MIKVYLYDLNSLKNKKEYLYRTERASQKRRPALYAYDTYAGTQAAGMRAAIKAAVNLGASAVLDEALKEYGLCEKDAVIIYGEHGKPALKDRPDIHFNISHSGKYVMCAVGNVPVGADIQKNTGGSRNLAKRFFAAEEYERIYACSDETSAGSNETSAGSDETSADSNETSAGTLFYRYWTLKESYVKATGAGIGDSFYDAKFVPAAETPAADNAYGDHLTLADAVWREKYCFREYTLPGYSAAVCSMGDREIADICNINILRR